MRPSDPNTVRGPSHFLSVATGRGEIAHIRCPHQMHMSDAHVLHCIGSSYRRPTCTIGLAAGRAPTATSPQTTLCNNPAAGQSRPPRWRHPRPLLDMF